MKKRKLTEVDVLLDNIGKTKENIRIVKKSELLQTGFSSEKNRSIYIEGCRKMIERYRRRLKKLGYSEQIKLVL
jgi:hypothetical protein